MVKIKKFLNKILLFILPENKYGDYLFDLIHFYIAHRRLPINKKLFSDYLFKIKNTNSIRNNDLRSIICDKELVKNYASKIITDKYIVKTIHILRNKSDLDKYQFPDDCCIKPTHLSGKVLFKRTGTSINKNEIESWFNLNYYKLGREKTYKNLKPKVIVEQIIFNNTNVEDYKFFCYKGKVRFIQIDFNRHTDHKRLYLNEKWEVLDFSIIYSRFKGEFVKPKNYLSCNLLAEKLSKKFEFIRIDLYTNGNEIFLGEMTNFPENIRGYFIPKNSEKEISKLFFKD